MKTLIRTHRFAFVLLALLALAPGCAQYAVVRQAVPNPFVGARQFSVEPVHFDGVIVGRMSEAQWLSNKTPEQQQSYMADRQAMVMRYVERLAVRNPGLEIFAGPPPTPQTFIIRPILEFIEPGFFTYFVNRSTEARMRVQILNQQGVVFDEFIVYAAVNASIYNPSTGGRLRTAADILSDRTTHYLRDRTGVR